MELELQLYQHGVALPVQLWKHRNLEGILRRSGLCISFGLFVGQNSERGFDSVLQKEGVKEQGSRYLRDSFFRLAEPLSNRMCRELYFLFTINAIEEK